MENVIELLSERWSSLRKRFDCAKENLAYEITKDQVEKMVDKMKSLEFESREVFDLRASDPEDIDEAIEILKSKIQPLWILSNASREEKSYQSEAIVSVITWLEAQKAGE